MIESDDSSTHLNQSSFTLLCRHSYLILGCACLLLILSIVVLVLYFTLFKPRDPIMKLISTCIEGGSPRVTLLVIRIELNITLEFEVFIHKPNYAALDYAKGHTILLYRGTLIGDTDVEPGWMPLWGDGHVHVNFNVEADLLTTKLLSLIADMAAGEVGFDLSTEISDRVIFLSFIKRHAPTEEQSW
ncbi:uncharacterized protein [Elaeis guineensis]|uniref:Uncharacterized protein LOC105050057 n=1 Tax=Elaeis guineensis var. tenera TaxID=51953 RepID=A0A6I9RL35_ELAGV|nr:uncharacterized protein LOC105050057 [Elaeis guineensis]